MKGDAKKSMWKPEEDLILKTYVETHGEGKWSSVSKKLGLHRDGKSCRLRWKNYLRPDIKHGRMSKDEEDLIIRMHKLLGNRWSLIAGRLPGRTDNEVKNYWNTHLSKKRVCRAKRKSTSSKVDDHKNPNEKSARTVRFEEGDNDHDPNKTTQERPNAQVENAQEDNNQNDDKEDENWSILGGQLLMESETGNSNRALLDTSFMDDGNGSVFMIPDGDEAFENQPWEHPWTDTSYFLFDTLENEWERTMFFP